MNNFNRWLRSKTGITTLAGVVVVALIMAFVGQGLGWWGGPGTVGLPSVDQDCMPSCEERDGRMIALVGDSMSSFGGVSTIVWVSVPQENASFSLSVFDGDSGKDANGNANFVGGNWDNTIAEVTYTLYADASRDGTAMQVVGQWSSNEMPNNDWFDIQVDTVADAMGESGDYFYRFEASRSADGSGVSAFKMKSQNAYLSMGQSPEAGTGFGIIGMIFGFNDLPYIYPDFVSFSNPGESRYNGSWEFQFNLPEGATEIEFWNGDADRGTSTLLETDTDDPDTTGIPSWAGPAAIEERAGGKGAPADDNQFVIYRRSPSIQFVIIGPDGNEIGRDNDPGGTEEWEHFVVSTDAGIGADVVVDSLPEGVYKLRIEGLDMFNALFLRTDLELFDGPPPPPPPSEPCVPENTNIGGGYAIIALNPADCLGEQNGLLFHGTSYTQLMGKAISNGCLRSVGTHLVESSGVEYVGEYDEANTKVKIIPDPYQVPDPVEVDVAAPNCEDPAAHHMDGKEFKGDVTLEPGLYCISGDVTVNAGDTLKGNDVTLYFLDGKVTINGGALVQLSAPYAPGVDVSPALSNILFYVPAEVDKKGDMAGEVVKINGNSNSYFSGVIYAPGSEVEFLGTSHTEGCDTTQIIGWDVRVGGTAELMLCYAGTEAPVCPIR